MSRWPGKLGPRGAFGGLFLGGVETIGQGWLRITKSDLEAYAPPIWDLYVASYADKGSLNVAGATALVSEFDRWLVHKASPESGEIDAFALAKRTPFGMKLGALGTNGTTGGKLAVRAKLAELLDEEGSFGEVSGAIEKLALRSAAPAICAAYVSRVLGKEIELQPDGVHYERVIKGVGKVQKMMVGRPTGIPTTSSAEPACDVDPPAGLRGLGGARRAGGSELADRLAHKAAELLDL